MVSREKTLAAAFRASPGMLAAPVTGVLDWWKLTGLDHSTAYGSCKNWGNSRMPFCSSFAAAIRWLREAGAGGGSGCTAVLFCCRTSAVAGDWWIGHSGYPLLLFLLTQSGCCGRLAPGPLKLPGCGSKRGRRGIRERPHLRSSATAGVRQQKRTAEHPGASRTFVGVKG